MSGRREDECIHVLARKPETKRLLRRPRRRQRIILKLIPEKRMTA
jgi:hypothetical protein